MKGEPRSEVKTKADSGLLLAVKPAQCPQLVTGWYIRRECASDQVEVLLMGLIFRNLCFVPLGLF